MSTLEYPHPEGLLHNPADTVGEVGGSLVHGAV